MSRIEDYALIGDCETAALVGRDGSIDWLCWPRFDSEACFARLLGTADNGRWLLAPAGSAETRRRYRPGTLILETRFEAEDGAVTVIDFMPLRSGESDIVRLVVGERGRVRMRVELVIRFDYGRLVPWVTSRKAHLWRAIVGPHAVYLDSGAPLEPRGLTTVSEFEVEAGQRVAFALTYQASHLPEPESVDAQAALDETEAFWKDWSARSQYRGHWKELVERSLITIKAMTYRPTGGVVAAPTTSLPERPGGERNWDYRFCWLRDATFTISCLLAAGYRDEAHAWRNWLLRAVAGSPSQIQPIYGIAGEHRIDEWEVDWLDGFDGARPVRIGNAAYAQLQLDVFGEVLNAMHLCRHAGLGHSDAGWDLQRVFVSHLESVWNEPDAGIWEVRGARQHFVHSKVMAWVAVDRAIHAVERFGLEGPVDQWRSLRARIHAEVCETGFDRDKGTFVQAFGSKELDASTLMMPLVGFLPATDPRMRGTVAAIERELTQDGLVLRYNSNRTEDGLPPGEGAFLVCSFWLADNYALQGRVREAHDLFEHLLALRNDVGLLSEQYDPRDRCFLGNFPQALSHLALVNTALRLERGTEADEASLDPGRDRAREDPPHAIELAKTGRDGSAD